MNARIRSGKEERKWISSLVKKKERKENGKEIFASHLVKKRRKVLKGFFCERVDANRFQRASINNVFDHSAALNGAKKTEFCFSFVNFLSLFSHLE